MVGQITGKNELKKNGSGYSDPTAYKAIMNVGGATVMNTYHGDIFYIANDGRAGETPAIIVSPDTWLEQDPEFVQAVLMTTKDIHNGQTEKTIKHLRKFIVRHRTERKTMNHEGYQDPTAEKAVRRYNQMPYICAGR